MAKTTTNPDDAAGETAAVLAGDAAAVADGAAAVADGAAAADAAAAQSAALAQADYIVLSPVEHDQVRIEVGQSITLTAAAAAPLLAVRAIALTAA